MGFSFSLLSSRCVFSFFFLARKSGAVQARTFHYHARKAPPETLPRKCVCVCGEAGGGGRSGGSAFIIPLSHYCQNMLYFTFCSREKFTFSDTVALPLRLQTHLNVEHLGSARIFADPWVRPRICAPPAARGV